MGSIIGGFYSRLPLRSARREGVIKDKSLKGLVIGRFFYRLLYLRKLKKGKGGGGLIYSLARVLLSISYY